MHVWFIVPCLLVTLLGGSYAQYSANGCVEEMKACTKVYLDDVLNTPLEICRLTDVYLGCVFRSSCSLSQSQKRALIQRSENELRSKGFGCKLHPVSASWETPTTTLAPWRTTTRLPWVQSTTAVNLATDSVNQLVPSASSECVSEIKRCMRPYLRNVMDHPLKICKYTQTYVNCVLGKCHFSVSERNFFLSESEKKLASKGFRCNLRQGGSSSWSYTTTTRFPIFKPDTDQNKYQRFSVEYPKERSSGVVAHISMLMMSSLLLIFALTWW